MRDANGKREKETERARNKRKNTSFTGNWAHFVFSSSARKGQSTLLCLVHMTFRDNSLWATVGSMANEGLLPSVGP